MRRAALGVCILLAVVLPTATGCDGQCSKLGCGSGITVTSTPAMAITSVTICAGGSCGTFTPACGPDGACRSMLSYPAEGVAKVAVDITATSEHGAPIERHELVSFHGVYPNGKRCGAACRVATVSLGP